MLESAKNKNWILVLLGTIIFWINDKNVLEVKIIDQDNVGTGRIDSKLCPRTLGIKIGLNFNWVSIQSLGIHLRIIKYKDSAIWWSHTISHFAEMYWNMLWLKN